MVIVCPGDVLLADWFLSGGDDDGTSSDVDAGLYYGNECVRGCGCGELCLFLCVNKWMVDDACNLHCGDIPLPTT